MNLGTIKIPIVGFRKTGIPEITSGVQTKFNTHFTNEQFK